RLADHLDVRPVEHAGEEGDRTGWRQRGRGWTNARSSWSRDRDGPRSGAFIGRRQRVSNAADQLLRLRFRSQVQFGAEAALQRLILSNRGRSLPDSREQSDQKSMTALAERI